MENEKCHYGPESMLANMDRVMRQLRRRPSGSHHGGRGSYRLLKTIYEKPGVSTKELSELMDIRRASLNEKLMRFESKGIIRRERDENDQRVQVVYLENSGLAYLDKVKEIRSKKNESISSVLTEEEVHELARLSDKLASGLENLHMENKKEKESNAYEQ